MKFQASVIFELKADSIGEAGRELNKLLEHAQDQHRMVARDVELRTPPAHASTAPRVILPPVTTEARPTGPQADAPRPRASFQLR
jgi:hypothetical protein